jgi:hypothetical protein
MMALMIPLAAEPCVYFVEVTLVQGLCHELSDAIVQRAIDYQIGTATISGARTLIFDRGPLSKNCRSFEMDMVIGFDHVRSFASGRDRSANYVRV